MKIVAGLGNPGAKYRDTRHNLGFMAVDSFARENGLLWRFNQDFLGYFAKSKDFVLAKPSTFMNKSGESIRKIMDYFKVESSEVLVIYDDVDLPFGKIRLSFNGLSAGHHGIDSVIENLGMEFGRLRVGIGHPRERQLGKGKVEDYVLEKFTESEQQDLGKVLKKCTEALASYLDEGISSTMNKFN